MIYILVGILSGFIGGMGIGGGTILIPILVFFFSIKQQVAQSINLISFIPLSIVAILIHAKNKNIELRVSLLIIIPGLVGTLFGSMVAISMSPFFLKKAFGLFLFIMGVYHVVCKVKNKN